MTEAPIPLRALESSAAAERADRLRRRFRASHASANLRVFALRRVGRRLLVFYWVCCLGVIAWGLDRAYPQVRSNLVERVRTHWGNRPFRNCAAAHAAGVYDIPSWSPAYAGRQDGDRDGLACEPPP